MFALEIGVQLALAPKRLVDAQRHDPLFGLTVDASAWLPQDQISASFDNVADAQGISPTLMDAYLTAASEIARQAIGQADAPASSTTY